MPRGRSGGRRTGSGSRSKKSGGYGRKVAGYGHYRGRRTGGYRSHRVHIIIPKSTEKTLIFPLNRANGKFDLSQYTPEMTNHQVNTEELTQFLSEIESRVLPWHTLEKRGNTTVKFLLILLILLFIGGIIATPLSLITTTTTRTTTTTTTKFPIAIPVMFGLALVCLIALLIASSVVSDKTRALQTEITQYVKTYVAERAPNFKSRDLNWNVPHHFPLWIELWKGEIPSMTTPPTGLSLLQYGQPGMSGQPGIPGQSDMYGQPGISGQFDMSGQPGIPGQLGQSGQRPLLGINMMTAPQEQGQTARNSSFYGQNDSQANLMNTGFGNANQQNTFVMQNQFANYNANTYQNA